MKPCCGEKAGFKVEINKINILLFALFLSCEVFPQDNIYTNPVPINGFCQFKSFAVPHSFNSLFALNFNNDSYTDLVLFSAQQKKIVSLPGKANGNFDKPVMRFVPYQISKIQPLSELNKTLKSYAFVSRPSMRAGVYSFTSSGSAFISRSLKFDSFPGNISTADVDKNGKDDLLISGSSFNGLSIVFNTGTSLKKKKIVDSTNFSNAVFADLSNDGYPDIAAFNILNYSLDFYYNNSRGTFRKVRSIMLNAPIHNLRAVDMNLDNYIDLLYSKGKSINIIYGDFASSYSQTASIKTKYYPDQIITGDFNRDGKIDIAYINRRKGIISLIFAKTNDTFFPEVIYHKKIGIENLIPFYSKFINGIALIDTSGFVYTITNLPSFAENVNLTLGAAPTAIASFDDGNNGINDISFIDSSTSTLNFLIRNNSGIPALLYSYPLAENHSQIVVDNLLPRVKIFFCFSPGKRLIEILKVNFSNNSAREISVYSPGDIDDLRIKNTGSSFDNVYISYTKNFNAGFCLMEYHDYRYFISNYSNLASDVLCTNVTLVNPPGILCWQKTNSGTELNQITLLSSSTNRNKLFNLKSNSISSITSYTGDLLNIDREITLSFINEKNKIISVASNYKSTFLIRTIDFPSSTEIESTAKFFFGSLRPNGLKKLYVYVPDEKSIFRTDLVYRGRDIVMSKIISAEGIRSFFVNKMSYRSFNLVYTDKLTNCISVRKL